MNAPRTLVTGCASGIGRRLVPRLVRAGHRVLATDRATEALAAAAEADGWGVPLRPLDVRESAQWDAALDEVEARWGGIDVLVHNAGVIYPRFVLDTALDQIDDELDTNLRGVIVGTRAAARRMGRGGHILAINSLAGVAPTPGMTVYSATKWGARGFLLGAAQELAPKGIAVTAIAPDGVDTPMARMEMGFPDEASLTFSGSRLLTVDEIADAVLAALDHRRVEVLVPAGRGALCKLAALAPGLAGRVTPSLQRRGKRHVERWKRR